MNYTKFSEIFEMFLNSISNDYRIKNLFVENEAVAERMLTTWLKKSIARFYNCNKDLAVYDLEKMEFLTELSVYEVSILSDLMLLTWMEWNINNITQMNLGLSDNDYNTQQ